MSNVGQLDRSTRRSKPLGARLWGAHGKVA